MIHQLCKRCQLWTALSYLDSDGVCKACDPAAQPEDDKPFVGAVSMVDGKLWAHELGNPPAPTDTDTADYTPQMDKYATQFIKGVMGPTYFPSALVFASESQAGDKLPSRPANVPAHADFIFVPGKPLSGAWQWQDDPLDPSTIHLVMTDDLKDTHEIRTVPTPWLMLKRG